MVYFRPLQRDQQDETIPFPASQGRSPVDGTPEFDARYRIEGLLGRGGMSQVLEATDLVVRRKLAIKVMPHELAADPELAARFLEEAQVTGQLEHPGICPVHEIGTTPDGRPYFTMKRIRGRTLGQVLLQDEPRPLAGLLEVFGRVCEAVAFAHAQGVIHRDLKPDNIMVGPFGEVYVMDWGLARVAGRPDRGSGRLPEVRSDRADDEGLRSRAGRVMGTPAYMAPEQARGAADAIGPATDVYALGALLYAILTLEPPVEGRRADELIRNAAEGRITAPRRRTPERAIPEDLEAVALKALALRPEERYPSAEALRREIQRFLEGRTLDAARYTPLAVLGLWVRRNRVFALTAGAAALLLLAATALYLVDVTRARRTAEQQRERATRQARLARTAQADAELQREDALASRRRAERLRQQAERRLFESQLARIDGLRDTGRWVGCWQVTGQALRQARRAGISEQPALVAAGPVVRRAPLPLFVRRAHRGAALALAFAPGGARLYTGGADGFLRVWDSATGELLQAVCAHPRSVLTTLAVSRDGATLVSGAQDGTVRVWALPRLARQGDWREQAMVADLALSPDGKQVVLGLARPGPQPKSRLILRALPGGGQARPLGPAAGGTLLRIALSPDGQRVAATGIELPPVLQDLAGGAPRVLDGHPRGATALAWSPDGARLYTGDGQGLVQGWLADGSRRVAGVTSPTRVLDLAVGPAGRLHIAGTEGLVRIHDTTADSPARPLSLGAASTVFRLALSGERVAAVSLSGLLQLWHPPAQDGVLAEQGGAGAGGACASPDGRLFALVAPRGRIRVWDTPTGKQVAQREHGEPVTVLSLTGEGLLIAAGRGAEIHLWNLPGGRPARTVRTPSPQHQVTAVGHAPALDLLLVGHGSGGPGVSVIDLRPGGGRFDIGLGGRGVSWIRARDTSRRQWILCFDGGLLLDLQLDPATRRPRSVRNVATLAITILAATAAPGNKRIFVAAADASLRLYDYPSWKLVRTYRTHTAPVYSFGIYGRHLLGLAEDRALLLYDPAGRLLSTQTVEHPLLLTEGLLVAHHPLRFLDLLAARPFLDEPELPGLPASPGPLPPAERRRLAARLSGWNHAAAALALIERDPEVSPLERGRLLWRTGRHVEARAAFEQALARKLAPAPYLRICLQAIGRK